MKKASFGITFGIALVAASSAGAQSTTGHGTSLTYKVTGGSPRGTGGAPGVGTPWIQIDLGGGPTRSSAAFPFYKNVNTGPSFAPAKPGIVPYVPPYDPLAIDRSTLRAFERDAAAVIAGVVGAVMYDVAAEVAIATCATFPVVCLPATGVAATGAWGFAQGFFNINTGTIPSRFELGMDVTGAAFRFWTTGRQNRWFFLPSGEPERPIFPGLEPVETYPVLRSPTGTESQVAPYIEP
jgi:hypothetical protein